METLKAVTTTTSAITPTISAWTLPDEPDGDDGDVGSDMAEAPRKASFVAVAYG
jgi:hypothetical protein